MKGIAIKHVSTYGFTVDKRETGFSISYDDNGKKATIFDLGKNGCSRLIAKDSVEKFWKNLQEINFQKVLSENECFQGCDGAWSIVELCVGLQTLTLRLWEPDIRIYQKRHLEESYKFLCLIHDIMSFAAENNVATDFKF